MIVDADEIQQIQACVAWAAKQKLKMILWGGYDAPHCLELLKKHDVPVIISGVHRLPPRSGEPTIIPSRSPSACRRRHSLLHLQLRRCLGRAEPAISRRHGRRLRPVARRGARRASRSTRRRFWAWPIGSARSRRGKDATLFVADGDILEIPTQVEQAFIQGRKVDLSDRHKRLWEKYKEQIPAARHRELIPHRFRQPPQSRACGFAASLNKTPMPTALTAGFAAALSTRSQSDSAVQEVCDAALAQLGRTAEPGAGLCLAASRAALRHGGFAASREAWRGRAAGLHGRVDRRRGARNRRASRLSHSGWLSLPGAAVQPMHLDFERTPEGGTILGWPDDLPESWPAGSALIVLGEPYSFPADLLLERLNEDQPGIPVVGGMASGGYAPGENKLLLGRRDARHRRSRRARFRERAHPQYRLAGLPSHRPALRRHQGGAQRDPGAGRPAAAGAVAGAVSHAAAAQTVSCSTAACTWAA